MSAKEEPAGEGAGGATRVSSTTDSDESELRSTDQFLLKTFNCIAYIYGRIKLNPHGKRVVQACLDSPQFKKIFDEADVGDKGTLGKEEVYTLVLRFYIFVAQYTFVVARHIPTRDDVDYIITHHAKHKDGELDFDDFKIIILLLCEGVATQLVAQSIFTVLLAPVLALCLIFVLRHVSIFLPFLVKEFWFIPSFLRNDKVGLMVFVPLMNMLVLPYYLEHIFYIQSVRNPNKVRFVPDMSQFQTSVPSPLTALKELTAELSEMVERRDEEMEILTEDTDNQELPPSLMTKSEDDLVILGKDESSKKDD